MLLRELKGIFNTELAPRYPKTEIDSFFYRLMEYYLKLKRFVLVLEPQLTLTKTEAAPMFVALERLKQEEPIQYILGEAHFMGIDLMVNEHVLIPRPETEELAQWAIDAVKADSREEPTIMDIGTGSGCIAIAVAKAIPNGKVFAIDNSEAALQVAKANAADNGVSIEFNLTDVLNPTYDIHLFEALDVIVSNPPYVRESEKGAMKNNVKKYEPSQALFVSDENPLLFYRAIADFAKYALKPEGQLFFEVNQYLAEETKAVLVSEGFIGIELKTDMFGNFRMLKGSRQNV